MSALLEPLLKLSHEERFQLVEDLWESLREEAATRPVPAWKIAELNRRREHLREHPESARTWEQIVARARHGQD